MDFAVPAGHKVKLKENEKKDKYLDFARELKKKKLWNIKVTFILGVIVLLVQSPKDYLWDWRTWK